MPIMAKRARLDYFQYYCAAQKLKVGKFTKNIATFFGQYSSFKIIFSLYK